SAKTMIVSDGGCSQTTCPSTRRVQSKPSSSSKPITSANRTALVMVSDPLHLRQHRGLVPRNAPHAGHVEYVRPRHVNGHGAAALPPCLRSPLGRMSLHIQPVSDLRPCVVHDQDHWHFLVQPAVQVRALNTEHDCSPILGQFQAVGRLELEQY